MRNHRLTIAWALLLVIFAGACNRKPAVPDLFKTQLLSFLEEGSKTTAKSSDGVSYADVREQVTNTRAAYELLVSAWPAGVSTQSQSDFDSAIKTWGLCLDLWRIELNEGDNPTEPDINGYEQYVDIGQGLLQLDVHDEDFIVPEYRGKKYVPFEPNIGKLMGIAAGAFSSGRDTVLRAVQ